MWENCFQISTSKPKYCSEHQRAVGRHGNSSTQRAGVNVKKLCTCALLQRVLYLVLSCLSLFWTWAEASAMPLSLMLSIMVWWDRMSWHRACSHTNTKFQHTGNSFFEFHSSREGKTFYIFTTTTKFSKLKAKYTLCSGKKEDFYFRWTFYFRLPVFRYPAQS